MLTNPRDALEASQGHQTWYIL